MKSITRFTKNLHGKKCLNCERDLAEEDNFCPTCGQVNDMNRLSIKQYFSEYLSGFFEFDNRFLRTVVPLLIKPGTVSKNYVNGKRIYYANPFQLYLHITILFFLMVGLFKTIDSFKPGAQSSSNIFNEIDPEKTAILADSIKKGVLEEIDNPELQIDSATMSAIDKGISQVSRRGRKRDSASAPFLVKKDLIRQYVDSVFRDSSAIEILFSKNSSKKEKDSLAGIIMSQVDKRSGQLATNGEDLEIGDWTEAVEGWQTYDEKSRLNSEAANRIGEILAERDIEYKVPARLVNPDLVKLPDNALGKVLKKVKLFMDYDKANPEANPLAALDDMGLEPTYWNVFYYNKARDWNEAMSDPAYWKEWVDRVLSRVSVALFFLLPVFTLIVSLLYIRHRFNYTENLVFVFHVQTVFFLMLMIFMIIGRIFDKNWVTWIFLTLFLYYLYKAMRVFYEQGRFKTIVKFLFLNTSFMILAVIGAVIVSFLAFLI
jgi:hypothetical protein